MTFGTILREARERKGYDLATAARRLRIRPDILRAIEEDDFSRMPPRGYARNMVNAYARLVGLNPTEMTRMYLDEAYAYQVGRARNGAQPSGFDRGGSSRTGRSTSRQGARPSQQVDECPPRQNAFGRTMYDDRRDYGRDYGARGGSERLYSEGRTHPSRHAALPNAEYTNFYAGPKASSVVQSKLPFVIAGGVILVLLIVVLVLVFGNNGGSSNEDVTKLPVTGLADPTQDGSGTEGGETPAQPQAKPVETAPTSIKVTYTIAKDTPVYAVITKDGTSEDQMFSGGEEDTVELAEGDVWTFAAWASDGVTIKVDGEAVKFDGSDPATGMPMATVDFDAYLEKWYEDHPDAKKKGSADADAADKAAEDGAKTGDGTSAA